MNELLQGAFQLVEEAPAGVEDRERERKGKQRRHYRSHIRHDTQNSGHAPPQSGIGNADQVQAQSAQDAKAAIHQELHQQVPADPVRCVVERLRHHVQLIESNQAEQTIAQVALFDQQEHAENQNDAEFAERSQKGLGQIAHILQFVRGFFDSNKDGKISQAEFKAGCSAGWIQKPDASTVNDMKGTKQ
jgi:hypothetical protein